jgi:multidrug efflux pump subunit AcrB
MIRFFAAHPTAANILMIIAILAGLLTLPNLKRETMPEIKTFEVTVHVPYPGAGPLDVEKSICLPLEDAIDGIGFIDEKRCEAKQNIALMTIKMLEHGDFEKFLDDIKSAVDGINEFPDASEKAIVKEKDRTLSVVKVALTADLPRPELKQLAEHFKQLMLQDPMIPLVEIEGFSERQFQIQVSSNKLRQYGLSLEKLASLISKQDLDLPVGTIETDYVAQQLRFSDERKSPSELAELIVIKGQSGTEVKLGDIATIVDTFELAEDRGYFNGVPAAFLKVSKNKVDDSLRVLDAVKLFIDKQQLLLPEGIGFELTEDTTSIVKDRIRLLSTNAWQGLLLVFGVMWLFFTFRFAFWVVMGLPVSFLASFYVLGHLGITINMISMVALLISLGILMDDAIVIAESIGAQIKKGKAPMQAAIDGTKIVARGVASSFATTLCIFVGLIFIEGNIGQILKVIPIVLISVICVSLVEAFLILPHHLQESLSHAQNQKPSDFRLKFEQKFEEFRIYVNGFVVKLINYRYLFIGSLLALFFVTVSILASGILKFSAFPNIEGNLIQARLLMPAGTPLKQTEKVVNKLIADLEHTQARFQDDEVEPLVTSVTISYNKNADAFESGPHLATINVNLLTAEKRNARIGDFISDWRKAVGVVPAATSILFKEPTIGPSGRAIMVRIAGDEFSEMASASYDMQQWFAGYTGVYNLFTDLRPGKPEYTLTMKPGGFALGLDAQTIANQLRASFQGIKVLETNSELDTFEVTVILAESSRDEFSDFDYFPIVHPTSGKIIPLEVLVDITPTRSFSRIHRVNNVRTVTVFGDVDPTISNTKAVIQDFEKQYLPIFKQKYPELRVQIEGEIKNGRISQKSMILTFIVGLIGVFMLLSFQFRSYVEPVVVIIAIPLAFIGVIWGHIIMGLDFTMPSMLGFVALAGIVVNDSILLVEFVKIRVSEGATVHEAAGKASYDRFRAVFLTSVTTIAGIIPLLFETSLQAQVLIPLATSIVFGITSSTLLVLFVIPALYSILEDFGWAKAQVNQPIHEEKNKSLLLKEQGSVV